MASDWFENDELFAEQLARGHRFAEVVAELLRGRGLTAETTPMEWRASIDDRHAFADEVDITVGSTKTLKLDVKSRNLRFTGPADYPYSTAFVDTVAGWDQKLVKPSAVVLVSQVTNGIAVIGASTSDGWAVETRFDNERRIHDRFYMVRRGLLRPLDDLAAFLAEHTE